MNNVVALIPAHNEASSIAATIEAALAQHRVPDLIVVIPNGCTDDTADIARRYPVTVMELPKLAHRKSEALNRAWSAYAKDADVVICLDADTVLPPNAVGDWEKEMHADATIGGSSSKFTMQDPGLLTRLQKAEFASWTDSSLRRGSTTVLAGTGCAIRGSVLREVASLNGADMKEEAWTRFARNGKASYERTATGTSGSRESIGSRTVTSGRKRTGRSLTDSLFDTSATTRRASDLITSSSERSRITSATATSVAVNGNSERLTASAATSSATLTNSETGSAGNAKRYIPRTTARAEVQSKSSLTIASLPTISEHDEHASGPWSYNSATEDFRLTMRIRQLGGKCIVSPTVRAYTDSMKTIRALWAQRMKWSVGTVDDLMTFGVNRLTLRDWMQQAAGIFGAFLKLLWLFVIFGQWAYLGELNIFWVWFLLPVLFVAVEVKRSMRIPHRDWKDVALAVSFFPNEAFMWLRSGWFIASWSQVAWSKASGRSTDLWSKQYAAEGV